MISNYTCCVFNSRCPIFIHHPVFHGALSTLNASLIWNQKVFALLKPLVGLMVVLA